jgi:hypothetical protein
VLTPQTARAAGDNGTVRRIAGTVRRIAGIVRRIAGTVRRIALRAEVHLRAAPPSGTRAIGRAALQSQVHPGGSCRAKVPGIRTWSSMLVRS